MHSEIGGVAWLIVVAGGAAALGVALIVATAMWLARDRRRDGETERATHDLYEAEEEERAKKDEHETVG